jgi:tetratricopeptide (TPR) repeat protein
MQEMPAFLCRCGSGLTAARCCALDLATISSSDAHRHLVPLEEQAERALHEGDYATAKQLALDVLELVPGRIGALAVLHHVHKNAGAAAAAEAVIRRIVALDPNNLSATCELTHLLLTKGALTEAERHARNAIRIAPENAYAHRLMGMTLTEANRPAPGEFHFRRALELAGDRDPATLGNLALALKGQGKMQATRSLYMEALAAAPDNVHILLGLARLEEADRNLQTAFDLLERAEASKPNACEIALARAVVLGRMGNASAAISMLSHIGDSDSALGAGGLLEKGRLFDRLDRYHEAFTAFCEGKAKLREVSGQAYLADHALALSERLKRFFIRQRLDALPRAAVRRDVAQPILCWAFRVPAPPWWSKR